MDGNALTWRLASGNPADVIFPILSNSTDAARYTVCMLMCVVCSSEQIKANTRETLKKKTQAWRNGDG
jgi:hypothetical protein